MMPDQEIQNDTSRRENITSRNDLTTGRITNKQKIYNYLLEQNKALTTTGISKKTGIDIKNISRYLKALESEGSIIRNTIQEGKRRLVYVKIKNDQSKEIITSRKNLTTSRIDQSNLSSQEGNANLKESTLETTKEDNSIHGSGDNIQKLQEISKKSNSREEGLINYLNGMRQEIADFGRVIPLDEKQRIVNWVLQNKPDLIDSLSTSLSAYRKEKYPKIIRQKKRWHEQMKFLEGLL